MRAVPSDHNASNAGITLAQGARGFSRILFAIPMPDDRESSLAHELPCRLDRLRPHVVVPDAGNPHEALGRVDQSVEPLGQGDWHDLIAIAVPIQPRGR